MNKETFFINILPTNDRDEDSQYIETALKVADKVDPQYFSYSLLTVGHKRFDPWILAHLLMSKFENFNPLIAVTPSLQHPIVAAKQIASFQSLFKNKVALNLVPGSFSREMESVNDISSFEQKQNKLHEFNNIIKGYLKNKNVMTYDGLDYQLTSARILPAIVDEDVKIFFSGMGQSLKSGNDDSYFIQNIKPLSELQPSQRKHSGLAMGVCARSTSAEAELALEELYPDDRKGQMLFEMAIASDDTPWNVWIKKQLAGNQSSGNDFHLQPMKNFWSAAPFIKGSYEEVSDLLITYHRLGYEFFVLDFHPDDFLHIEECIKRFRLKS